MTMVKHKGGTMAYVLSLCCVLLTILGCVFGQAEQVIHYRIQEEVPEDTWIGNIAESLGLNASMGTLEFGFLSDSHPHQKYFSVCCGGELRTRGRYDRDTFCPGSMDGCVLNVDITVRTRDGGFYIAKVLVEVEDIEDNAPEFPEARHVLYLSESTQLLASFALPVASDPDASTLTYTLTPSLPQFELRVSEGECHLVVKQALDREERAEYSLALTAQDPAANTATLDIEVSVLDVNDNAPSFEQDDYAVYVFENVAVGSTLLQVHAEDPDDGAHSEVTYSLSAQSVSQLGHMFRLEPHTGELILRAPLNYGERSEYSLRVVAQDHGTSSLAAYTSITLHIRDLNDHAPQIRINALTPVPEHTNIGTFVAHVSVQDQDGGDNGKFECSLNDTNFALKRTFPTEYKLVTAASLDRESQGQYQVRMLCTDLGSPPQESTHIIDISVEDINDHAPQFERKIYEVSIAEDTLIGEFAIRVRATDADIGENGRVSYSLRGACTSVLAVDADSGVISVRRLLDHEERSVWECQILGTDHGKDPSTETTATLSTAATLRVLVRDVNDEAPHFPAPSVTLSVAENQLPGAAVGDVVAYDRDAPPHNVLTYRLADQSPEFEVQPETGSISTLVPLDRESMEKYLLRVIAEDQDGLSSEVEVQIMVLDVNDNAPVIQAVSTPPQVSSSGKVGHIITHVRAMDADTSHNAQLRYFINTASIPNLFAVNPLSGAVTITQSLQDHRQMNISLVVVVKDRGEPQLQDSAEFHIFINGSMGDAGASSDISDTSSIIIIGVLSVTAVVSFILIAAIVCIVRRRRLRRKSANQKPAYSCHIEPTMTDDSDTSAPKYPELATVERKSDYDPDQDSVLNCQQQQPRSHHPMAHHPGSQRAPSREGGRYGSNDGLGQNQLTAGKLQVHNVLIPHHTNHNAPIPDGESDRGSSDSGRGASEEECQNTSSDSLPVRPSQPSRSNTPQKAPADCLRHSQRPYKDCNPGIPMPAIPKRTCKVHGHLVPNTEPPKYPVGSLGQHNVPVKHNAPKYNAPMDYGGYGQSFDTSIDGHSDGGSTTSGEYVVNLDDFHGDQPSISKDVYV